MVKMEKTQSRKLEHVKIGLGKNIESHKSTGFEDVELIHKALPELEISEIDVSMELFNKKLSAPIFIESMTGGTPEAEKINKNLARAAQELGIAMGVGSQRMMIEDQRLAYTYQVRDVAPDILLFGNLGIAQFIKGYGIKEAEKAVKTIEANGLCIHLNALQELVQLEGDRNFKDGLEKLTEICSNSKFPIIAKETGCGISGEVAIQLEKAGVSAIDTGGVGGTSFAAVESYRGSEIGKTFWDWGIPTAVSLIQTVEVVKIPVIASGGIRNGLDGAKALALGASAIGIASPLLKPAIKSSKEVVSVLQRIIEELKIAMLLSGAKNINQLRSVDRRVTGKTREMLQ